MADPLFKRGFKSDCEDLALATRAEIGIGPAAPLSAGDLAAHLGIPVLSMADLDSFGATARDLSLVMASVSAVTVFKGTYRAIFYNPRHPSTRLANSLTHEVSHTLLEHLPSVAVVNSSRDWDRRQESEADWLAATLLVPREGALKWLRAGGGIAEGAAHFAVSEALFRWRVNTTGLARQMRMTA